MKVSGSFLHPRHRGTRVIHKSISSSSPSSICDCLKSLFASSRSFSVPGFVVSSSSLVVSFLLVLQVSILRHHRWQVKLGSRRLHLVGIRRTLPSAETVAAMMQAALNATSTLSWPRTHVVTLCCHLYWACLYEWLHVHAQSSECPVCKAIIKEEKLAPLYGRGKSSTDPQSKTSPSMNIPHRPAGQRPATALPPPDPNNFHHGNPWFMGGAPMASTRFGNYTFSAAIGGLFPHFSFQVNGFPAATAAYGLDAGFHYGYGHAFHGGHHVHGFLREVHNGQQADVYLKALLFLVSALVIASLVWF
ncbi:hypothetical protein ZIOFF_038720 [Zingiber officinale]|uniref:E3 ubiquitin-protein ligase RMA n=1 Tax=Zingiber officinale TaxID=94328 RepID=A0A8J5G5T3_ZINOF|nr:hypothetical protein ZIOFF_038720 [Zingiber officinale]